MGPWYKAMQMADWPNFSLSLGLIKPCDLPADSHIVECSAPRRGKIWGFIVYDKLWLADSIPVNKS